MATRYAIGELLALGHSEAHVSRVLGVPLPEVHRVNATLRSSESLRSTSEERRRDGARMKAEWEPRMRPHTKMLEPEMKNGE